KIVQVQSFLRFEVATHRSDLTENRCFAQRKHYLIQKDLALKIQAAFHSKIRQQQLAYLKNVICVQAFARGWLQRRIFLELKKATITLQTVWRGSQARLMKERQLKSIVLIQSLVRAHLARKRVATMLASARTIQLVIRRYLDRVNAAVMIQSAFRRWHCR